jgi:dolichyl-phosphate beta-glucosyltransferase
MSDSLPSLSVIIPAYNEEQRLPRTLARICAYLRVHHPDAEVIVVDDGSEDGTARVVAEGQVQFPGLRLVSNGGNRGKGHSVRRGMLEARGHVALFTDADDSVPIEEAENLLAALEGADIAIGSRGADHHQSRLRSLSRIVFHRLVRLLTGLRHRDTQCGFKAFVRERTRILFEQQRIEGFAFDPEILFLARRYGLRTVEVPVHSAHDLASKVRVLGDGFLMFCELLLIRWNWLAGRYPRSSGARGGRVPVGGNNPAGQQNTADKPSTLEPAVRDPRTLNARPG